MKFPDDIHRVPLIQYGGGHFQLSNSVLPDGYKMMKDDSKAHILHEKDIEKDDAVSYMKQGVSICGRETRNIQKDRVEDLCIDCIKHMEKAMQGWMYDEQKDEWYNPKQ